MDGHAWKALEDSLAPLGLDGRRARLYGLLVTRGPLRASELASAARMQRTEAYRAMEDLVEGGFATESLERPTRYAAVPPQDVWQQALGAHRARMQLLDSARGACLAALEVLAGESAQGTPRISHRILSGREAIYEAVEAMIAGASRHHWMASSALSPGQATLGNRPFQATVLRAREGLPMRLVFQEGPGAFEMAAPFAGLPNVEVRTFAFPAPLRFTIVDGREIIQWLASDPSARLDAKGDVAMATNAPDFLATQIALYEALWVRATPWGSRRVPVQSRVG